MRTFSVSRVSSDISHTNDNAIDGWVSEILEHIVVNRLEAVGNPIADSRLCFLSENGGRNR